MRTWFVIAAIFVVTCVYSIAVMVHMALFRDRDVFFYYARSWSRILLRLAGVKVKVEGAQHLVPTERYIYVSNHASLFDIPVILAYVPDNVRIMYKRELERIPIFGWCLKMSPFIGIDRSKHREASDAIDATVRTFASGSSVAVFPEGTRSPDGQVGVFKRGAFTLAARSGRSLVAIALVGTASILPARTKRLHPGTVRCVILPPRRLPEKASRQDEVAMMQAMHADIATHVTFAS